MEYDEKICRGHLAMHPYPRSILGSFYTAKIGEGGRGEVYRGRDTSLDRDVFFKIPRGASSVTSGGTGGAEDSVVTAARPLKN